MKLKIIRATVCGGKPVEVGEVVDASERDARTLIALGKARPVKDEPQPEPKQDKKGGK